MIFSCCFIVAFALLTNICTAGASVQGTVEGVIGGFVVLQCFSSINEHNLEDIKVLWRHNDKHNVCDIIQSKCSAEHQDSKYKNRTETFPEEYEKGNFSLKLNNLTHTDAGKYQCYITHSSELVIVQLLVNESTEAKENQPATEEGNKAGETKPMWIMILFPVLCVLVLVCISVCIALKCKRFRFQRVPQLPNTTEGDNKDQ